MSNSVNNFLYDNYALMAGCLDTVKMPNMEWLETTLRDRRNLVASISSGVLVSSEYIIKQSSVKNKLMVLLFSFSSAGGWPLMLQPATRTKMTSRTSFIFVEFLEPYPCLCKHIF